MSDLGQRLVDAASDAFDVGTMDFGPVVANVLRELADQLFEQLLDRVEPGMVVRPNIIPDWIRGVADRIEKGEDGAAR